MHQCPVCGYPNLMEAPRAASGGGSYEICPSCGFQFGVDDDDKGISHEQWREKWITGGTKWQSQGNAAPKGWDAKAQLAGLGGKEAKPQKNVKIEKPGPKAKVKPMVKKRKSVPKKAKMVVKKSKPAQKKKAKVSAKKKGKGKKR